MSNGEVLSLKYGHNNIKILLLLTADLTRGNAFPLIPYLHLGQLAQKEKTQGFGLGLQEE